jgi:ubiquinone/menaquinone biosynthesis C-methylase UbiE
MTDTVTAETARTPQPAPGTPQATPAADLDAIKQRQRAAWGSGDYSVIGTTLQIVGEMLCEAADVRSGSKVLDVAAGNGNCSLAAARRWCDVTSTDYVAALLEEGRRRASAERLPITFQEADAEALPFDDAAFDVILSSFGVMFTPNHARAAGEMLRVCRSGGRIALANWTPRGFIGRMFGVIGRYVPPPAGVTPPSRWGTDAHIDELFGASASSIAITPRHFAFRYRDAGHFIDVFRTWYGPVQTTFARLGAGEQERLAHDLRDLLAEFNTSGDSTMVVPSEYLEIVIVRS